MWGSAENIPISFIYNSLIKCFEYGYDADFFGTGYYLLGGQNG